MTLQWVEEPYPHTADGRFQLHKEQPIHEGTYWALVCTRPEDQSLLHSPAARHIENGWYGPGAKARAKRAARQLVELADLRKGST
jgi:hypothetical protein